MAKYVHIHENIAPVVAGIGGAAGSFGEIVAVDEVGAVGAFVTADEESEF